VRVQVTRTAADDTRTLSPGRRVVVTWTGSDRSTTITRFDRSYRAGAGSTFACPEAGQTIPLAFSYQLYQGSKAIGVPFVVNTALHRLGLAS
jgi:hypothetical protein